MKSRKALTVVAVASMLVAIPLSAAAGPGGGNGTTSGSGTTCRLPDSNADALEILSNYYPGYWWDHTDLTIAAKFHPSATTEQQEAIRGAIATWSATLIDCFDGLITLTDVTGQQRRAADIVVHYVPDCGRRRLRRLRHLRRPRMPKHPGAI